MELESVANLSIRNQLRHRIMLDTHARRSNVLFVPHASHLLGRMVTDLSLLVPPPTLIWEFEQYPGLWRSLDDSLNDILSQARSSAHSCAEYVWQYTYQGQVYNTKYEFDLDAMIQTNTETLTVRQIRAVIVVSSELR
jgi:hypothetical protein